MTGYYGESDEERQEDDGAPLPDEAYEADAADAPEPTSSERRYRSTLALLSLWAREAREAGVDLQGEIDFEISFDYDGMSQE